MFKVLPVIYHESGFAKQSFAFGGEGDLDAFDASVVCPRCKQPKDRFNAA